MAASDQAAAMTAAVAIFVKTPGFSPLKTRLAATLGSDAAVCFHRLAAAATAEVVQACADVLAPYWAIAESAPVAAAAWPDFPVLIQGEGGLGERLDCIYTTLQERHGRVLLIGADAPQLTPALLRTACAALDDPARPYVMGEALDGGFWLFGGRRPVSGRVWREVAYSQGDTALQLRQRLAAGGAIATIPALDDVDEVGDLFALLQTLDASPARLPGQNALRLWLRDTLAGLRDGTATSA